MSILGLDSRESRFYVPCHVKALTTTADMIKRSLLKLRPNLYQAVTAAQCECWNLNQNQYVAVLMDFPGLCDAKNCQRTKRSFISQI